MKINGTYLISNFKKNLIEDFYQQNKCINSKTSYVFKLIEESKDDFTKKRQLYKDKTKKSKRYNQT